MEMKRQVSCVSPLARIGWTHLKVAEIECSLGLHQDPPRGDRLKPGRALHQQIGPQLNLARDQVGLHPEYAVLIRTTSRAEAEPAKHRNASLSLANGEGDGYTSTHADGRSSTPIDTRRS